MLSRLQGAFALGIIFSDYPDLMIAARRGSPLALGIGDGENYLGSDAIALAPLSNRILYLEEGDWAEVTADKITVHDASGKMVTRPVKETKLTGEAAEKNGYPHFMLKEIYEQPAVLAESLGAYAATASGTVHLPKLPFALKDIKKITLVACGTSYYAGCVARYWLERYARLPVEVDIASEYRYRYPVFQKNELVLCISQSGETADTLAALRLAKQSGAHTLALVNVAESSLANEADGFMLTYAGPEIGVASTKAFTTQLLALACISLALAEAQGTLSNHDHKSLLQALNELPIRVQQVLGLDGKIAAMAKQISEATDALYIGRGMSFPIAQEGALKLKELSYIHAEAYAAGEMKHGPIALIDEKMPLIAIAPGDELFAKTLSNIQEASARGARILLITDEQGKAASGDVAQHILVMPWAHPFTSPILYALPVQLLAYHTAILKGTDVDQPRNLAKSVTVE